MNRDSVCQRLLTAIAILSATASFSMAAYQPTLILKHPFASEYTDSHGNTVKDSLIRRMSFTATLYRIGMTDSLPVQGTTNDSGFCLLSFNRWMKANSPVEPASIERLAISFPKTWRAIRMGARFTFEPLRFDRVIARYSEGETLVVLLPLSVTEHDFTYGSGDYGFDFAVISDIHIAEGKKLNVDGREDFGTY